MRISVRLVAFFSRLCQERERERKKKRRLFYLSFFSTVLRRESSTRFSTFPPRSAPTDGWQKRVERISKEGYDYFSTPFFFPYPSPLISTIRHIFLLSLSRWLKSIYICVYVNNSFRELETRRGHVSLAGFRRAWRKKGGIDKRKGYLFLLRVKRRWRSSCPQPSPR